MSPTSCDRDILHRLATFTGRTVADVAGCLHSRAPTVSCRRVWRCTGRCHLAIVISDEFPGDQTSLVTLRTWWRLIGEITNEFDLEAMLQSAGRRLAPRVVPGGVTLEELAEQTGVELPDGDLSLTAT